MHKAEDNSSWYWQTREGSSSESHNEPTFRVTESQTVYLVNRKGGCSSEPVSTFVKVNSPVDDISLTGDTQICVGGATQLTITGSNLVTVFWYEAASGKLLKRNAANTVSFSYKTPFLTKDASYRAVAYNRKGCAFERLINVEVSPPETYQPVISCLTKTAEYRYQATADAAPSALELYWQTTPEGTDESDSELIRTFREAGFYYLRAKNKISGCWGPASVVEVPDLRPKALAEGLSENQLNYVRAYQYRQGKDQVPADPEDASVDQIQVTTQYLDQLSRPLQTVVKQATPGQQDMVQPVAYDGFSRVVKQLLPYAYGQDGKPSEQPYIQQANFYQSTAQVADSPYPFGYLEVESAPTERVLSESAPGQDWVGTVGTCNARNISYRYQTNAKDDNILTWKVLNPQTINFRIQSQDTYNDNELLLRQTLDEQDQPVYEYVDKREQVVLKKVVGEGEDLLTYYVYDNYGQLRVVIPPAASAQLIENSTLTLDDALVKQYCFVYHYDKRARMTIKQVPGAEPVYMVYDRRDRLVLTQDGNQRGKKQWLFTKYDGLNRPIMTGLYKHPGKPANQEDMQGFANGEEFTEAYDGSPGSYGYSNTGFPDVTGVQQLFSVSYYDHYEFLSDLNWDERYNFQDLSGEYPEAGLPTEYFGEVRGQLTGSITRVLNTKNFLNNVTYYDDRYRPIQTVSQNYLEGEDLVTIAYDFIGQLLHSVRLHSSKKVDQLVLQERYHYDHAGRLMEVYHRVNQEPEVLMVQNKYNAIGELVDKQLHYQGEEDLATYLSATLSASKTYNPSAWQNGELSLANSKKVEIPRQIPLTVGNAGNHELTLTYRDANNAEHTVSYRGGASVSHVYTKDGTNPEENQLQKARYYNFYSSSDGVSAGQIITVSYLKLNVNNGDSWDPAGTTAVTWSIEPPASLFVQSVDYRYNIRGWLTSINNSALSNDSRTNNDENDWFGMELFYNQVATGLDNALQYNGNISAVKWSHHGENPEVLGYSYQYDPYNRLSNARFTNLSNASRNGFYDVTGPQGKIRYDLNGNIEGLSRYGTEGNTRTLMDNLSYTYQANQLLNVTDAASGEFAKQGFRDGTNQGNDYRYDANGNLIEDWNKDILDQIKYNHLNLPRLIAFDTGGEIRYIYDANGRKLRKRVIQGENQWVTDYVDGIQYKREKLAEGENTPKQIDFVMTAEGRIRYTEAGSWVYDYDMKDHLGNVRMTIASEASVDTYVATMENKYAQDEEAMFQNVAQTRHRYQNANATPVAVKLKKPKASARLNATQGNDIGPTKSLAVAFGDTVRLSVQAYYEQFSEGNGAAIGNALTSVVSAFAPAGMVDGKIIYDALNVPEALANLAYKDDDGSGTPQAYLNYMLFDEDYVFLHHGFQRVSTAAENKHELIELEVPIGQAGYIYLYVSNQSKWNSNVFFDELIVEHQHSPIQDNVDYYPFGGLHTQQTDKLNHKYLYNGKEFQDELGLNWYDYGARMYDPMVGKYFVQDRFADKYYSITPYQYAANDPINLVDINGDSIWFTRSDNIITMHVTGKVLNLSSNDVNMETAVSDITSGVENVFNGSFEYEGAEYEFNAEVQLESVESMDDVADSDHLVVFADSDGTTATGVVNQIGGKTMFIDAAKFPNHGSIADFFGVSNTRSAIHETGHMAGLTHESASGFLNLMVPGMIGTNVTSNQFVSILRSRRQNIGDNYIPLGIPGQKMPNTDLIKNGVKYQLKDLGFSIRMDKLR